MPHPYFFLLLVSALCFGCETEEVYELPTSQENFIALNVDGQEILLNALPARTANYYYRDGTDNELYVEYTTSDNRHSLFLQLADCALAPGMMAKTFRSGGETGADCRREVTIGYTTFQMNESPSCPHLDGVPTLLTGRMTVDRWTANGQIEGSFESDPTGEEEYVLRGTFQTTLD
jgi:hypothetical protein